MEDNKKKGIFAFIMEDIINIESLFLSGKIIFMLILGALAIERWLEISSSISDITTRAICYSVTMLISIWLVQQGISLVFVDKK